MPLELVPLCTVDITLSEPLMVGSGPAGFRLVVEVETMAVTGERLRGQMKGRASADWITLQGPIASVDVRATIETDDGAIVFCHYTGRIDFTDGPGTAPVYVAPLFETGDDRYQWLNLVQAAGVGTMSTSATEIHYEWFELRA
jgi:hypothetical protein